MSTNDIIDVDNADDDGGGDDDDNDDNGDNNDDDDCKGDAVALHGLPSVWERLYPSTGWRASNPFIQCVFFNLNPHKSAK